MKKYETQLTHYHVDLFRKEEELPNASRVANNGIAVVNQKDQAITLEVNDDIPLFLGGKGFLTGKAYSLNESIRERPLIDLQALLERFHLDPKEMEAYIGPSLTFAHIEQPDEVLMRVRELGYELACKGTSGKHYLDQQVLVLLQLRKMGIPMKNIHISCYDTYDEDDLASALKGDEGKNYVVATLL